MKQLSTRFPTTGSPSSGSTPSLISLPGVPGASGEPDCTERCLAQDRKPGLSPSPKGRGGNEVLKRVFYQSAFCSMRAVPESKAYYDRKGAEGKRHTLAVIAPARRVNVLQAMLRDGATFESRSAA